MTAIANIGMASQVKVGACGVAAARSFDQPQQPFSDSLLAASNAYSEADSTNDGNTRTSRRQKPASEDEEASVTSHHDDTAQSPLILQQAVQPQQAQAIPAEPASSPISIGGAVTTAVTSTETPAEPAGIPSSIVPSGSDLSQAAPSQPGAGIRHIDAPGAPLDGMGNSTSSVDATEAENAAPTAPSTELLGGVVNASSDTDSIALPEATQGPALRAALSAVASAILASKGTDTQAGQAISSTTGTTQVLSAADLDASGGTANQLASSIQPGGALQETAHASVSSFNSNQRAKQSAALSANGNDQSKDANNNAAGLKQHTQLAAGLNASSGATSRPVLPIQPGTELNGTVHASGSSFDSTAGAVQPVAPPANGKYESKDALNNAPNTAAGPIQHGQLTTDHAGSQASSQQDAPADDPSHGSASSQGQSATLSLMNATVNSVAVPFHAQNTLAGAVAPSTSTQAGLTDSAAKLPQASAPASAAAAQSAPVINTAKLIQSIGQSEMRVGMRSNEFGNISISTTANKDVISAQISLDHGELAKALASQLPEMQARLTGNQAMEVRIDMNGASAGQGTGTSGSMSKGASDQSNAGKQQSAYAGSSYSDNLVVERQFTSVAAAAATGYGNLNTRLDIRV